jgi:thymidylate kinase
LGYGEHSLSRWVDVLPSRVTSSSRTRRHRLTVALVGADGAGKSTLSRRLETADLPAPVKTIYMGVNLEASSLMLPTTRLLLAAKRAKGGRPDLVASSLRHPTTPVPASARSWRRSARDSARMTVWIFEEWLRQIVATGYGLRGYIVVFDRHFFADYYHTDIATKSDSSGLFARLHGWMLQHAYPKPDLVICLDAPAEVLYLRKPEASPQWLEQRRQQYLNLAGVVPAFAVVDADRELEAVYSDVLECIRNQWKAS